MQPQDWFQQKSLQFQDSPAYQTELLLLDINEQIVERMVAQGVKRAELARRLGFTRAFVTRLLNGKPNLTLKTLVEVANALDMDLDMRLKPRYAQMQWRSVDLCATEPKRSPARALGRFKGYDESAIAA
jgi:Helix-turn-helix.